MKLSMVPFLLVAVYALLAINVHRVKTRGHLDSRGARSVYLLLGVLLGWGAASTALAVTGRYLSPAFVSLMPGLWVPCIAFVMAIGATLLSPRLRAALRTVVDHTPQHWWISLQGLRVLALGTMVKAVQGVFPAYFAFLVGVPDMLFGLSAIVLALEARRRPVGHRFLILWNLISFASRVRLP